MLIAAILGLVGLILIYFEFFVPGGVLGVLGALCIIIGLIFSFSKESSLVLFFVYLAAMFLLLALTVRLALWSIKKNKRKNGYYLEDDQEGYVASSFDKELVGKMGKALTSLRPSGHVRVEDKVYQAVAQSGYINKGSRVKIIGGEGARFIVKEESE